MFLFVMLLSPYVVPLVWHGKTFDDANVWPASGLSSSYTVKMRTTVALPMKQYWLTWKMDGIGWFLYKSNLT